MTVLYKIVSIEVRSEFSNCRKNLLSGNCDGGHGGNGKGEDVELHFDGLKFVDLVFWFGESVWVLKRLIVVVKECVITIL